VRGGRGGGRGEPGCGPEGGGGVVFWWRGGVTVRLGFVTLGAGWGGGGGTAQGGRSRWVVRCRS